MTRFLYFCKMKRICTYIILTVISFFALFVTFRKPIITGEVTKQTIYLWLMNSYHIQSKKARPTAMLIDDDNGDGIFKIRQICNELGIKATFAVIPSRLDKVKADSLKKWQKEGFGIALHGYNHDKWTEWPLEAITTDIQQCEHFLQKNGFINNFRFVVPPHACNTTNIRNAIKAKGYLMISGANIINPDTTVFQYGRYSLDTDHLDLDEAKRIITKAYKENAFVIFGTHSSMNKTFSEEKTKEILNMAKSMGFKFI